MKKLTSEENEENHVKKNLPLEVALFVYTF